MATYAELGIRPVINGVGPATRLGGLPLADEIWQAMRAALDVSVRMDELHVAAGRRIAELVGAPDAFVTSGAAAALAMATTAAMTHGDPALLDRLPDVDGMPNEVIIQADHCDPYDRSVEAVGARILVAGYPGTTHPGEIERLISDRTAAMLYRPGRHGDLVDLATMGRIGAAAGIPVIVDAAVGVPPIGNVAAMFSDGASAIAVSGGKGLRGPQSAGLLLGVPALIADVGLAHWDMDEIAALWHNPHPAASGAERSAITPPRHGVARAMKVGREQIMGMLTAVERYVAAPAADEQAGIDELTAARAGLAQIPSIDVTQAHHAALDVPRLIVDFSASGADVFEVTRRLREGEPRVFLGEGAIDRQQLHVNPMALLPGDGHRIARRVAAIIDDLERERTVA